MADARVLTSTHSTNISFWKKKSRSRAQYFVEYDAIPDRTTIKRSSPGWTVARVTGPNLELFNRLPSSNASDSKHHGQKRSIQDMTREDYAGGIENEPCDHRKKPRISGKENAFDCTAPDTISQFKGKPSAFADSQNTSRRESCRTDPNSKLDSEGGTTHLDTMALSVKNVCAPLTVSMPSNVPAPTLTGSNLLPLGSRICVSTESKAIVASLLSAGAPLREDRLVPISTREEVLYTDTLLCPQRTSMHANERNGRKWKTPEKKSSLSALQVAQNSLREAENALRAEREKGNGLQDQFMSLKQQLDHLQGAVDGMHKRVLKEVEARRAAEERLSQERVTWKRCGEHIKVLLDQEETVAVEPSLRTSRPSTQPSIKCKQEPIA